MLNVDEIAPSSPLGRDCLVSKLAVFPIFQINCLCTCGGIYRVCFSKMPGKHKFVPATVVGGVPICEHCGNNKNFLDGRRVDGKLPSCPDAPDETSKPQAGKY